MIKNINKSDIRDTKAFKEFLEWELDNNIMHYKNEELQRNLEVFIQYLGSAQSLHHWSMERVGKKFGISKERVRQIFNKYLTHFIVYLHFMYKYDKEHFLIETLMSYLSRQDRIRLLKYFDDGKPFRYITYKEIFILNYKSKMSLG